MKKNHKFFSNLAFKIAENNLGKTKDNPSVGCIIEKNGTVISSGVTSINGRPHAEYNALKRSLNYKDASMYLTLEPCTHYGITPPCTNLIKKKKIKKVFYCFEDPDTRTYKKAKAELFKNKIILKKINFKTNDFYKSYYINKKLNLPFIDAKIAISNDFFTINKKSKWITNFRSRKVKHLLRSKYDCIVSTSKSINADNSLLNCRINGFDENKPDLIIIDMNLQLKKKLKLFKSKKKRNIYLFTSQRNKKKFQFLKKNNIKIIIMKSLNKKKDFFDLLNKIYKIGKRRVLMETGLTFLNEFLRLKLINNLYVFKSNKNLSYDGYNNSNTKFLKKLRLKNKLNVNLNGDDLFKERIK